MRNSIRLMVVALLPALVGCSMYDVLFAGLGRYYSGGGTTRAEKQYDYDRQIEAWQDHAQYGTSP
jgi:hypothetical protein